MSKYSTVRIDVESKKKLEELAEQIGSGINIKISKATALKLIIEEAYDSMVIKPTHLLNNLESKNTNEDLNGKE